MASRPELHFHSTPLSSQGAGAHHDSNIQTNIFAPMITLDLRGLHTNCASLNLHFANVNLGSHNAEVHNTELSNTEIHRTEDHNTQTGNTDVHRTEYHNHQTHHTEKPSTTYHQINPGSNPSAFPPPSEYDDCSDPPPQHSSLAPETHRPQSPRPLTTGPHELPTQSSEYMSRLPTPTCSPRPSSSLVDDDDYFSQAQRSPISEPHHRDHHHHHQQNEDQATRPDVSEENNIIINNNNHRQAHATNHCPAEEHTPLPLDKVTTTSDTSAEQDDDKHKNLHHRLQRFNKPSQTQTHSLKIPPPVSDPHDHAHAHAHVSTPPASALPAIFPSTSGAEMAAPPPSPFYHTRGEDNDQGGRARYLARRSNNRLPKPKKVESETQTQTQSLLPLASSSSSSPACASAFQQQPPPKPLTP